MNTNSPQHKNPTPPEPWNDDLLWEEIESNLDKDKRNRLILWLMPSVAFLMLVILTVYYTSDPKLQLTELPISESIQRGSYSSLGADQINLNQKSSTDPNSSSIEKSTNGSNRQNSSTIIKQPRLTTTNFIKDNAAEKATNSHVADRYFTMKESKSNFPRQNSTESFAVTPIIHQTIDSIKLLSSKIRVLSYKRTLGNLSNAPLVKFQPQPTNIPNKGFLTLKTGASLVSSKHEGSAEWESNMNDTETPLYALNTSLTYAHRIKKMLYFESGIHYQRQINKFESEQIDTSYSEVVRDTAIIINSVVSPGKLTKTTETKTIYSVYNRLHRVTLPLRIGSLHRHGRHSLYLSSGLDLSIISSYKGFSLSSDQDIISLTDNRISKPKFLSLQNASFSFDYGITLSSEYNLLIGGVYFVPINEMYHISSRAENSTSSYRGYNLYVGISRNL